MDTPKGILLVAACTLSCLSATVFAADDAATLQDAFTKGKIKGEVKSYFFAQTFESDTISDADIWANGGYLNYETAGFYGVRAGATFQASFVGAKNDDSGVYAGDMDANGAVLSESFLQYDLYKTRFKGGRQHIVMPLIANSGTRLIKESFEGYFLSNTDLPDTTLSAGWVNKYQTRTDRTTYSDNPFVDFDGNGSGEPGDFYDIGSSGLVSLYGKNESLKNLVLQAQYTDVLDEVAGLYADATYTFADIGVKPFLAAQYYYTNYDQAGEDDNSLFGVKTGLNVYAVDLFAAYTKAGGSAGDARVYRGLGQGAYFQYTATTKTSGALAFEADTNAYQVGAGYKYQKSFVSMFRFTVFDSPIDNADLNEYTLDLAYNFGGIFENFSVSVDFSVLDYDDHQKDATDLRSRLIYAF